MRSRRRYDLPSRCLTSSSDKIELTPELDEILTYTLIAVFQKTQGHRVSVVRGNMVDRKYVCSAFSAFAKRGLMLITREVSGFGSYLCHIYRQGCESGPAAIHPRLVSNRERYLLRHVKSLSCGANSSRCLYVRLRFLRNMNKVAILHSIIFQAPPIFRPSQCPLRKAPRASARGQLPIYPAQSQQAHNIVSTMSQCPHCFVGQCQRHKLQDHGMRERKLKAKMADPKAAQRRLYDAIVAKQLDKLEAASRGTSESAQVRKHMSRFEKCFDFFLKPMRDLR